MKIAITGHTEGIGAALARAFEKHNHSIVGLSKSNGYNIKITPRCADAIDPCHVFVNNAQAGFAQTELLFEMHRRWAGQNKWIIVISTMMTQEPVTSIPGLEEYRVQKVALEEAVKQLRHKSRFPRIAIVRPGDIATTETKTAPPSADVDRWAEFVVNTMLATEPDLWIDDISVGPRNDS